VKVVMGSTVEVSAADAEAGTNASESASPPSAPTMLFGRAEKPECT
jgi:hypothetical protein